MIARGGAALLALLVACTLPPLRGRIEVGKDAYGVFVGEGSGGADLYAFHGTTGTVVPITFSPVAERAPAVAPDGATVAFLRSPGSAWIMNLLSGAERALVLPRGAPLPDRIGWEPGAAAVYVGAGERVWRFAVPPGPAPQEVRDAGGRARADSAFAVLLGEPAFGRVERCQSGGLCIVTPAGDRSILAEDAVYASRWGGDSVAWVAGGDIRVRPLGGGIPRTVELDPARAVIGGVSYFTGRR